MEHLLLLLLTWKINLEILLQKAKILKNLTLTENVAPTVNDTLTLNGSNEVFVSFSEAVKSVDLDDDENLLEGITVKVNGTTAESY